MHIEDKYVKAKNHANELTQLKYGDFAIPFEYGTEIHDFWLEKFDEAMNDLIG
jgi:hypothetical protein